ncbi:hypothetical protein F4801DRAFT_576275 [Xylaria longipes]|nr:hypothetical protein F4801DRAFT_576275 [Xylaria longipes]RYC63575.1 hypothetical protein CHU98_g2653 [Xylaria longipes]
MDSNNAENAGGAQASQNAVNLFSVYPAKLFYDLWLGSDQPECPEGRKYVYEVVKRNRIYGPEGKPTWCDFTGTIPRELEPWGTETLLVNGSLYDSNEFALLETHDLLVLLRNWSFQPVVKHEVQENGCIHLRVNFGPKSYFTVRVHRSER